MKPGGDATTFNIDHIAVGPEGVFVIETKTRRKPTEAGPDGQEAHNVIVSDNTLRFPNGEDRKAIKQAQLQAKDLADWLNGPSSTRIPVTPVVALPGWFVKDKPGSEVAVRSGRNIAMSIPKLGHEAALSPTQVRQIAHQIDKHCRDIEGE
jgi:hypothetical protein